MSDKLFDSMIVASVAGLLIALTLGGGSCSKANYRARAEACKAVMQGNSEQAKVLAQVPPSGACVIPQ